MTRTAAAPMTVRRPLLFSAATAVAAGVLAALTTGAAAAASAVLALLVVAGFFGATLVAARVAVVAPPQVELALLLMTYVLKVAVLVVVLGALEGVPWVDRGWLGGAVMACTAAWLAVQVGALSRARLPITPHAAVTP